MKIKTIIFAAALLASNAAYAQSSADSTRAQLSGMGYTNIEIERVGNNYKVEAVRGTQKRLITYDALTGEIQSDVSRRENRSERTNRGSNNANSGKRGNSNDADRASLQMVQVADVLESALQCALAAPHRWSAVRS